MSCLSGGNSSGGPWAVFDASTGTIVLDRGLIDGLATTVGLPALLRSFARHMFAQLAALQPPASSPAATRTTSNIAATSTANGQAISMNKSAQSNFELSARASMDDDPAISTDASVSTNAAHPTIAELSPRSSLAGAASVFAAAAGSAVSLAFLARIPLWFCLACPVVLGMLAPFLFNYGLTATAEAVCAQLQLPAQDCADLW